MSASRSAAVNPASSREPRGFRRWRRTRPFWGGAFAVTAGAELILIPLAPLPLTIHQGIAGVASWLIGLLLIVAGLGLWLQPQQHAFYGILALLLAVTSFVTSNLGGYALGMLLGMVGGALGFAWTAQSSGRHRSEPDPDPSARPDAGTNAAPNAGTNTGPAVKAAGPDTGRTGRAMAVAVLPAALGASMFAATPAEPSPSPLPTLSTPGATTTPAPPSTTTPGPQPGGTTPTPQVTATPSPAAPDQAAGDESCPEPPSTAGMSRQEALKALQETAPCVKPGKARATSGLPVTTSDAVTLRADRMSMSGLRYDGVFELPTGQGSVRALRFTMDETTLTAVDQTIRHGPLQARATADTLAFSGDVVMYTTKLSGKVFGLLPLTFTPDSPPPLVLSSMSMTDLVTEHPHVLADSADADGFSVGT